MTGGMGTAGARFGLGSAEAGNLLFQVAYDLNNMNSLFEGTKRIEDNDRQRIIHTGILEANYGFSRRLSLAAIWTFMGQELGSPRQDGSRQVDYIRGMGDLVLMVKYRLMNPLAWNGWGIYAGLGPEFPTGRYSYSGSEGSVFPMDIQPGSGSIDVISWLSLSKSNLFSPNLHFSSGAAFRLSGENKNYQDSLTYRFGNDFQYTAGVNYSFAGKVGGDVFGFLRYRFQNNDTSDEEPVEKTGGHWLYISPGFKINLTNNFAFMTSVDLPLYRNLKGPQLTTTSRISAGLVYTIASKKVTEITPGQ